MSDIKEEHENTGKLQRLVDVIVFDPSLASYIQSNYPQKWKEGDIYTPYGEERGYVFCNIKHLDFRTFLSTTPFKDSSYVLIDSASEEIFDIK